MTALFEEARHSWLAPESVKKIDADAEINSA